MKARRGGLVQVTFLSLLSVGCDAIFGDGDITIPVPTGGIGDPCTGSGTCRTGLYCDSNECTARGDLQEGSDCEFTASCAEGLYCDHRRVCAQAGEGVQGNVCQSTAECQAGLVCDFEGFTPTCLQTGDGDLGKTCTNSADCFAGLSCASARCVSLPAMDGEPPPPLPPTWPGVMCPDEETPPSQAEAIFELPSADDAHGDFFRLPYPNDIRRTSSGIDLSGFPIPDGTPAAPVIAEYVKVTENLEGFSPSSTVHFRFTHEPKIGLADIQLVNLDTGSDHGSRRYLATSGGRFSKYMCPFWAAVAPNTGDPLAPGTTYAAIIKSSVVPAKAEDGASFARSETLSALLAEVDPGGERSAPWRAYAPLRNWIAAQSVDASTILNAAVFTTSEPATVAQQVRAAVQTAPVAMLSGLTLCDGQSTSPCDDGTATRACSESTNEAFHELHAKISLPLFQKGSAPYEAIEDGGGFEFSGSGAPVLQGMTEACVSIAVPKAQMPENGYPVLVYAHGTGGSFRGPIISGVASDMATASVPIMTVALDMPQHGSRKGASDAASELLFFNFDNPGASWGNVMQGAADIMAVARWVETWTLDAGASPTGLALATDATALGFYGHSQGSTHGSLVLPFEPRFSMAVLSGNGGHLAESLLNKKQPVDIASVIPFALADYDSGGKLPAGVLHPVMTLFQTYFDSVDGLNHAQFVLAQPLEEEPYQHVLMTYGLGDSYSPEATMRAYAVEGKFPIVGPVLTESWPIAEVSAPYVGATKTIAIRQYMPGDYDGHFVATRNEQARGDVTRFISEALAGNTPAVGQ